ncbi:MAG: glycoside hydrolase, partial [Betaproteobacteria bacterium]|nr:glycoside hydrolase [Betaproteobacteria bacterium]
AVVNLVPILLEQIEDYAQQFASGQVRDPLLRLLVCERMDDIDAQNRARILDQCFLANHSKMLEPFAPYRRLREIYQYVLKQHGKDSLGYLSGQYFADLLTWYHLCWTGESVRRDEPLVVRLMTQGEGFTREDRRALFDLIGSLMSALITRYRRLQERGQIEISTTPYYHPIAPLLINLASAREAMPDATMPQATVYPGGRQRTAWHVKEAQRHHQEWFGTPPQGMWPAEGAVSWPFAEVVAEHGLGWIASGERVLRNTLAREGAGAADSASYSPYSLNTASGKVSIFFRDDRLSDLIGFEYKGWHGRDAASHFIAQVEEIRAKATANDTPVVSVILDGENAWEHYPYNGFYFFKDLYETLSAHESIRTTTFSSCIARRKQQGVKELTLGTLVTGSWVYGNLSTWIGSPDKNRAWDLLCTAKQSYDWVMGSGRLTEGETQVAALQLAACEGSDWYWWFGDYNPPHVVRTFDEIFRACLVELYRLLKLAPPAALAEPISRGGGEPESGGAMRRAA